MASHRRQRGYLRQERRRRRRPPAGSRSRTRDAGQKECGFSCWGSYLGTANHINNPETVAKESAVDTSILPEIDDPSRAYSLGGPPRSSWVQRFKYLGSVCVHLESCELVAAHGPY